MSEEKIAISQLRPKTWVVLETAIEEGVSRGFSRAHKHNDNPSEEDYRRHVQECVLSAICDWFHVDNEQ